MRQIAPGTWRQRYLCCDWRRSGGARRTCSRSVQPRFDPPKMSGNLGAEGEKKRRGQKRAASEKGRRHVAREARTSRLAKQCCWQRGHSQSPSLPPWGIFTTEVSRTTSSVPPVCAWKASGNMAIASASMASSAAFWAAAAAALWPMLAARIAAWARGTGHGHGCRRDAPHVGSRTLRPCQDSMYCPCPDCLCSCFRFEGAA